MTTSEKASLALDTSHLPSPNRAAWPSTGRSSGASPAQRALGTTRLRRIALTGYAVILATVVAADGVPTGRLSLSIIVVAGLAITRIGRGRRAGVQVVADWLPFTAVLMIYDRTRGVADGLGIALHESDVAHLETSLFGGSVPTVWLQQHLYNPTQVYWYDALCTLVYTSHFLATPVLAAALWLRNRAVWKRYIARVILLSANGLITYLLFPEAPPWLAARDGVLAPVGRLSARGWIWLHAGPVNTLLARAQVDGGNPVAAMPSLHTAFATLIAVFIAARTHSKWRYLLALYPAAMGFTLVYTGEHYVIDVVAGVLYALVVHWALTRWEVRRGRIRLPDRAPDRL